MSSHAIVLSRHPASQFDFSQLEASGVTVHTFAHPWKSELTETSAPNCHVFEDYDTSGRLECEAFRLIADLGPENVRGILALSEVDVLRAARLRSHFGIRGMKAETALLFRDKVEMKQTLGAAGLRVPETVAVDDGVQVCAAAEQLGYPFVLKPRLGGGSVGTMVVRDRCDLEERLQLGIRERFYLPGFLEAEEFVDGTLHHCDGLVVNGEVEVATVSRYLSDLLAFDVPIASCTVDPGDPDHDLVLGSTRACLEALGLVGSEDSSYFHCEVFVSSGSAVICEVAARPGGLGVVDQLDAASGVLTFRRFLNSTLDVSFDDRLTTVASAAGWIGVPPMLSSDQVAALLEDDHLFRLRWYDRPSDAGVQRSSVDLDGVATITGSSHYQLATRLHSLQDDFRSVGAA